MNCEIEHTEHTSRDTWDDSKIYFRIPLTPYWVGRSDTAMFCLYRKMFCSVCPDPTHYFWRPI